MLLYIVRPSKLYKLSCFINGNLTVTYNYMYRRAGWVSVWLTVHFDVSCINAPSNICDFFTKANSKHKHETRFSSSGNYYVQTSRLNLNQDSFSRFGAKLWNAIPNEFRQLSKGAFKKKFHEFLLSIMEVEDDYVEVPILLQKMTNSASSTIDRFC